MAENKEKKYDLFNNPMVDLAKKSLSPEQKEEYKKWGEYMFSSTNYQQLEVGKKIEKPSTQELALYAYNGIKSGLDPQELSDEEISAINSIYGKEWYKEFGLNKGDIPVPMFDLVNSNDPKDSGAIEDQLKKLKVSRQERRKMERDMEKARRKNDKEISPNNKRKK